MRSTTLRFGSIVAVLALVLTACGGTSGESQGGSGEPASSGGTAGEPVEIHWFC